MPLPAPSPPVRLRPAGLWPVLLLAGLAGLGAGCDHGLTPPAEPPVGTIRGLLTYRDARPTWPSRDSLQDLRFVAMRFVPQDTADLLQLNRIVFSEPLDRYVAADTVVIDDVATGTFVYTGVAQKYGPDVFAWRPVGLYEAQGGVFQVRAGETTDVAVYVDFRDVPPFPPPSGALSSHLRP